MDQQHVAPRRMKVHYLLQLLTFWLFLFAIYRIIFLAFHTGTIIQTGFTPAAHSLVAGLRLDLSTISFLMFPSLLLWAFQLFVRKPSIEKINSVYNISLMALTSLLAVGNIKMYHEWGSLLTSGVFDYMAKPDVVVSFVSTSQLILLIIFLFVYFTLFVLLYKKWVTNFSTVSGNKFVAALVFFFVLVLLPVFARGGFQLAPINESSAYYSETPFYNHVAVNPLWYFMHSCLDKRSTKNPFLFMDEGKAEARNNHLFSKPIIPTDTILTTTRPNIIIIILESWTADIIQSLGGEEGITPNFDTLRKEGLLFTQIYGAGSRTEHGLISVLSGYPPPPQISIITMPSKAEKLSSINGALAADGYSSSFFYGGEIGFVNMKSYLVSTQFEHITDKASFNKNQLNSKWGAHDQYVFDKQIEDLKTMTIPFFSVVLTLSSHEPFEVPMQTPFNDQDEPGKFRKAAYYADHCLGEYFKAAKKEKWYDNTLFILVADHGHRLPRNTDWNRPESKHIPLLFLGNVLKQSFKGTTNNKLGNQHDIATTLLNQLGKDHIPFSKSKDLLNPKTNEFAYYTNNDVMGWVTPQDKFIYVFATHDVENTGSASPAIPLNDSIVLDAKAYVQTHYAQFLKF